MRLAPAFPWLPGDPIDGLVPHRDPTDSDVLFTLNEPTVAADRTSLIIADVTRLLARISDTPASDVRREMVRIAALAASFAALVAAQVV